MPYGLINADVMQTSTTNGVLGAKNASTLQNRLIDAGFTINQRGYVSGNSLSSGTYAHDRWKAGSGGCTYTFTQLSTGVPIVITITAGSLQQVIEGCNMPEGGTYVLSWTGTAQARFNGGTYGSSPLAVTGITAGANTTIEFNTGTCSYPQLEVGSSATGYEYRQYGQELALCQRYFESQAISNSAICSVGQAFSTTTAFYVIPYVVTKRSVPTFTFTGPFVALTANGSNAGGTLSLTNSSTQSSRVDIAGASGLTIGNAAGLIPLGGAGTLNFSAEL